MSLTPEEAALAAVLNQLDWKFLAPDMAQARAPSRAFAEQMRNQGADAPTVPTLNDLLTAARTELEKNNWRKGREGANRQFSMLETSESTHEAPVYGGITITDAKNIAELRRLKVGISDPKMAGRTR